MPIIYTKERAEKLVNLKRQIKQTFLDMYKEEYPEGTKVQCNWVHRNHLDTPNIVYVIVSYDKYSHQIEHPFVISRLFDLGKGVGHTHYTPLKALDSLGRPNGEVYHIHPREFERDYTIVE